MIPIWATPPVIDQSRRILRSFRARVGRDLLPPGGDPADEARALFHAPFALLSHGVEADPILNYGNAAALALWDMDFAAFTAMPSRLTAEPTLREDRARLLQTAREKGYIDDYRGVRISANGARFWIEDVILWTVDDEAGAPCGQAARIGKWSAVA